MSVAATSRASTRVIIPIALYKQGHKNLPMQTMMQQIYMLIFFQKMANQ